MARVSCIVLSSGRAAVLPGGVQENPENVAVWEAVGRLAPSLLARWEREPPVLRLLLARGVRKCVHAAQGVYGEET